MTWIIIGQLAWRQKSLVFPGMMVDCRSVDQQTTGGRATLTVSASSSRLVACLEWKERETNVLLVGAPVGLVRRGFCCCVLDTGLQFSSLHCRLQLATLPTGSVQVLSRIPQPSCFAVFLCLGQAASESSGSLDCRRSVLLDSPLSHL